MASRARIVGGCSAHNACLVVWGSRADYDEWGDGWTFSELEPFLQRAEAAIDTRTDRDGDLSLPSRPARCRTRSACRGSTPSTISTPPSDRTGGDQRPGGSSLNTRSHTWSGAAPANLTIVSETLVDRVTTADVRGDRVRQRTAERRVIVSGGHTDRPRCCSGVALGRLGRWASGSTSSRISPSEAGSRTIPGIGIEWAAAPATCGPGARCSRPRCSSGRAATPVPRARGISTSSPGSRSGRRLADECRRLPAEAGFARLGHPAHTRRPGSTGRRPWLSRGGRRRRASRKRRRDHARPGRGGGSGRPEPGPSESVETYVRREAPGIFHPTGTCAMGAVVDACGAVLGVDGLFSWRTLRSCRRSLVRTRT